MSLKSRLLVYFYGLFTLLNDPLSANTDWLLGPHDAEGTHCQPDEKILSQDNAGKIYLKWFKGSAAVLASPSIHKQKIFYGDSQGILHCLYTEDGAESWNTTIGSKNIMTSPALVEENIYVTCPVKTTASSTNASKEISHLIAVKRKSGKYIWKAYAEGGNILPQFEQAPMRADDLLIVGSSSYEAYENKPEYFFEGGIYAFDSVSGFLKWRFLLTDKASGEGAGVSTCSAAAVDPKLGYAYVATSHAYENPSSAYASALICVNYRTDKRDGEYIWSYSFAPQAVWSGQRPQGNYWGLKGMPLLFKAGSKRYVGLCDNNYTFHAVDRQHGKFAWSTSLLPEGQTAFCLGPCGAAFDDDAIYAASNSINRQILPAQILLKPFTKEKETALLNLLALQVKSTITALKPKSGSILWQNSFDSAILGEPSVANHLVFVSFFNGYLRILNAKTGETLYQYRTGPASGNYGLPPYNLNIPLTSTPVISNGRLFATGGYAFPQDATKIIPGGLFVFEAPPKEADAH